MNHRALRTVLTATVALATLMSLSATVSAATPEVTAVYRPDLRFPEFMPMWREGWRWLDENGERVRYAYEGMPLGGYLFAHFRNTGNEPLEVKDVLLQGVSLAKGLAWEQAPKAPGLDKPPANLQFSKLPKEQLDKLYDIGEPVWWKVDPTFIPPGGQAELTIRLRRDPKPATIDLAVPDGQGGMAKTVLDVAKRQPQFFSISFSEDLKQVFAYLRHPSGKGVAPSHVFIDDTDVTANCTIGTDETIDTVPVIITLPEPLKESQYYLFRADYPDGSTAKSILGAWHYGMVYGMWGSREKGTTGEEMAREFLTDMATHNINVHMHHSSGLGHQYMHSEAGLKLLKELGMRHMLHWTNPDRDPIFYFLTDEPDAADFCSTMLDPFKRIGSLGQYLVERCKLFRRHDPKVRPILLNIDNTFKPENWYTYGQLTDIACADPYYQEGVQSVWHCDPTNMGPYLKPTYVYGVGEIYHSACAPRPMHLILHSCRFDFKPEQSPYRAPTPEEKRVEVYYSLASGAQQISYWWYTPGEAYYGVGGDTPDVKALWKEIGLVGAEARTIGSLVTSGSPANLTVKGPRFLWARCLVAGVDTVVLLAVNDNFASDRLGTVVKPLQNVQAEVQTPAWLKARDVFEVTYNGTSDVEWKTSNTGVALNLGTVPLTRMIVITKDTDLRNRLQAVYAKELAGNVKKLLADQ